MSKTSRRHTLSPLQTCLSTFLYITDLDNSNIKNSLIFEDKIVLDNKIDSNLRKDFKKMQETSIDYRKILQLEISKVVKYLSENMDEKISKNGKSSSENYLDYLNRHLSNLVGHTMSDKFMTMLLSEVHLNLVAEGKSVEAKGDSYLTIYLRERAKIAGILEKKIVIF